MSVNKHHTPDNTVNKQHCLFTVNTLVGLFVIMADNSGFAYVLSLVAKRDIRTSIEVVPLVCRHWRNVQATQCSDVELTMEIKKSFPQPHPPLSKRPTTSHVATQKVHEAIDALLEVDEAIDEEGLLVRTSNVASGQVHCSPTYAVGLFKEVTAIDSLLFAGGVRDIDLFLMGRMCPELKSLKICSNFLDNKIIGGSSRVSRTSRLDKVTNSGLLACVAGCTKINEIILVGCNKIDDEGVRAIAACCGTSLRSFGIANCDKVFDGGLTAIAASCKKLRYLYIKSRSDGTITDAGISAIGAGCPDLRQICFRSNCWKKTLTDVRSLTDVSLRWIASGSYNLERVDVEGCPGIWERGLGEIAERHDGLKVLSLRNCTGLVDDGLMKIGHSCPQLRWLNLGFDKKHFVDDARRGGAVTVTTTTTTSPVSVQPPSVETSTTTKTASADAAAAAALSITRSSTKKTRSTKKSQQPAPTPPSFTSSQPNSDSVAVDRLTPQALTCIARGCPLLTHIDLQGRTHVDDDVLDAIGRWCPNLTTIKLSGCHKVTDTGLMWLIDGAERVSYTDDPPLQPTRLTRIDLDGCKQVTDLGLQRIAEVCDVQWLNLGYCDKITETGLIFLCRLAHPHLSRLDLTACTSVAAIPDGGGLGAGVLDGCTQLKVLKLNFCGVDDRWLKTFTKDSSITNLDLTGCNKITDDGLLYCLKACPRLEQLSLAHCDNITDGGISTIASDTLRQLQHLDLSGCRLVTDGGLANLSPLRELRGLNLSSCDPDPTHDGVTGMFLPDILESWPNLREIDATDSPRLADTINHMIKALPYPSKLTVIS